MTDLNQTDDQFFYTDQVGGYMHTGLAGSWSIAHKLSVQYLARSPEGIERIVRQLQQSQMGRLHSTP